MNQFDKWMQKSLQDRHEMPTPDDLREMDRLLNQRDNKRRGAWWWWAGALGIALLAGAVIWWNETGASMQNLQQTASKNAGRISLWIQPEITETTKAEPTSGQSHSPAIPKDAITKAEVQSADAPRAQTNPRKSRNSTTTASNAPDGTGKSVIRPKEKEKENAAEKEYAAEREKEKQNESGNNALPATTLNEGSDHAAIASTPDSKSEAIAPADSMKVTAPADSTLTAKIDSLKPDSLPSRKRMFEVQAGASLTWPSAKSDLLYARGGLDTDDQLFLVAQDVSFRICANRWQFGTGLSVMRYNPGFIYEPIAASDLTITGEGQNIQINFVDFPEIIEAAEQLEAISMFNAWTIPVFAGYTIPIRENRMEVMPRAGLAVSFQSRETLTYTQRWVPYYDIPQIQVYQQREYFPITRTNRKQSTNALIAAEFRFILPRSLILIGEPGVWLDPGRSTPGVWNRAPYFRFSIGYAF
jgi:hypothetical protein